MRNFLPADLSRQYMLQKLILSCVSTTLEIGRETTVAVAADIIIQFACTVMRLPEKAEVNPWFLKQGKKE